MTWYITQPNARKTVSPSNNFLLHRASSAAGTCSVLQSTLAGERATYNCHSNPQGTEGPGAVGYPTGHLYSCHSSPGQGHPPPFLTELFGKLLPAMRTLTSINRKEAEAEEHVVGEAKGDLSPRKGSDLLENAAQGQGSCGSAPGRRGRTVTRLTSAHTAGPTAPLHRRWSLAHSSRQRPPRLGARASPGAPRTGLTAATAAGSPGSASAASPSNEVADAGVTASPAAAPGARSGSGG